MLAVLPPLAWAHSSPVGATWLAQPHPWSRVDGDRSECGQSGRWLRRDAAPTVNQWRQVTNPPAVRVRPAVW